MKRLLFVTAAVGVAWGVASWLPMAVARNGDPVADDAPPPSSRFPVLLVPGWLDTGQDLSTLRARFIEAGWPASRVRSASFDDPAGSNREHALELDVVARSLLRETGADSIDVVAFSMGGLATRWYLLRDDAVPVRRVVFLATPQRGTMAAHLAWGESREEMIPESPFLDSLNAAAPLPSGIRALTVRTPIDTHVIPGENATLPGVPDREVCCPTHSGMLQDPQVFSIVRMFLQGNPVGG